MAHEELGPPGGEPVLCWTVSRPGRFRARRMIAILADVGLRVITPELIDFGRSDKPADVADHSYAGTSGG